MFDEEFSDLVDKYNGHLYCEELLEFIHNCHDNKKIYSWGITYHIIHVKLPVEVFCTLRDVIYRNAHTEHEAQETIKRIFSRPKNWIPYLVGSGSLDVLRALAEIVPNFDELLMGEYENFNAPEHQREWMFIRAIWDTHFITDSQVKTPHNYLDIIDFFVDHSKTHEDILITQFNWGETVLDMMGNNTREWLPYLMKWIRNKPELLNHRALKQFRSDLIRALQEAGKIDAGVQEIIDSSIPT